MNFPSSTAARLEDSSSLAGPATVGGLPSAQVWIGRCLSGLLILFLLADGLVKLVPIPAVSETLSQLGYPTTVGFERGLGVLMLLCTLLYAVPQTEALGAVLLTGYLGGAIASQLRIGNPVFSHLLFGVYLGVAAWAGLWLRSRKVRALLAG